MDFRQFRTFVVVAEEMHMGRAAERLDIAQPAVTQQIKALEAALGFQVFRRVRRGIELTEAGSVFLKHAKIALADAETAVLAGRRASRGELGRVCIAYAHSVMLEPELPALLKQFSIQWPLVEMELRSITVGEQLPALADERIDVAFLRAPTGPLPDSISIAPFSSSELAIALPSGHRAANARKFSLRDLSKERFIIVDDPQGMGLGHVSLELCHTCGFEPENVILATDALCVLSLVHAGLGIGIVPESLKEYAREGTVLRRPEVGGFASQTVIATRKYDGSAITKNLRAMAGAGRRAASRKG